jgi:predicted dehydrogenase
MHTIRVGFVGLGGICRQRHVPGLRRIEGVEIVAVANRSRASSERAAKELGVPVVCESWQELVARSDLDAVFIGTWPYMHRAITLAALDAGKHVFCQARMAMDLPEAMDMYERARAAGRVAMLCPVPFGLSIGAAIARLLQIGRASCRERV